MDPIETGRNWYSYCYNNPVNAVDPDGGVAWWLAVLFDVCIGATLTFPEADVDELLINMGASALAGGVGYVIKAPMFVKGAASSFTASMTTQYLQEGSIAWDLVAVDTVVGAGFGAVLTKMRPTPIQSEQYVGRKLGKTYSSQVTFQNGNKLNVTHIVRNSTRLDFYKVLESIEVKNYNISTGRGRFRFVDNVSRQAIKRMAHMSKGTTQTLYVDIRGTEHI